MGTKVIPIGPHAGGFGELRLSDTDWPVPAPSSLRPFKPARTSGHIDLPLDSPRAEPVYGARRGDYGFPIETPPAPISLDQATRDSAQRQSDLAAEEERRMLAERVRLSMVTEAARVDGHQAGHRVGYIAGVRWGIFCGAVAGVAASIAVGLVVVLVRAHLL